MKSLIAVCVIAIIYIFAVEAFEFHKVGYEHHGKNENNDNKLDCIPRPMEKCPDPDPVCTRYKNTTICRAFVNRCDVKEYNKPNKRVEILQHKNSGNCTLNSYGKNTTCIQNATMAASG